jgi:outer membrane protein TolC
MLRSIVVTLLLAAAASVPAGAAPLTADQAVKIALQHNTQSLSAEASVLDAKSGLWSAYSSVLPNVSGAYTVSHSSTDPTDERFTQYFGPTPITYQQISNSSTSTSPTLSGRWNVFNVSSLSSLGAARSSSRAAQLSRSATRNDVALLVRQRFYDVVRAIHLADVSSQSLKLARDNERRVRALYEVGSVSKSDLLKAKVSTGQSAVDSLVTDHSVTNSRIALSEALGMPEKDLGDIDTTLSATYRDYDEAAVFAEAREARPDIKAAEADAKAAEMTIAAARWARLPYVSAAASATFKPKTESRSETEYFDTLGNSTGTRSQNTTNKSNAQYNASIALNWDLFDLGNDARAASAKARMIRSRETRDALVRNLQSEVHQAMLGHQEAVEREGLARQTLESATENLNLVQQKYNVGSATILDLIDSQVQFQRAKSDLVSALASIRVSEATLERVRGKGE